MERNCPVCGGVLSVAKVRLAIVGSSVGSFDGYRCSNCGEEFLAERSIQPAHDEIVRAGLFGILRMSPAWNPLLTIPFTISKTGSSGPSTQSQSGLILAVEATASQVILEGHTPRQG